jgi:hypothetical protein
MNKHQMKKQTQQKIQKQAYKKVKALILSRFIDNVPKQKATGCLIQTKGSHLSFKTTSGKIILIRDNIDGVHGCCDGMNIYGQYDASAHLLEHGLITRKEFEDFHYELRNVKANKSLEEDLKRLKDLADKLGYTIKPNKTTPMC